MSAGQSTIRLGVVIPAYNAVQLPRCLAALSSSKRGFDDAVVVDDGSAPPVAGLDLRLIRVSQRGGPGRARNLGAAAVNADVLVFVDADVQVAAETLAQIERRFLDEPDLAAIQTVYSRHCPVPGFASQFQNLLQHWNVSRAAGDGFEALTSYCVAIRREAFEAVGGFDASLNRATIEDDNLGINLARAGHRISVDPSIEVQHLAEFTAWSLCVRMKNMATDKLRSIRAQPDRARVPLWRTHHRPAFVFAAGAMGLAALLLPLLPGVSLLLMAAVVAVHADFLAFLAQEKGPAFAAAGAGMTLALALSAALGSLAGVIK